MTATASFTRVAHDDIGALHRCYRATNDQHARSQLVEAYEPLARAMASRVSRRHDDRDELVQIAMIGLLKAVDRFDPDRGVAFSTFAWATISGEIRRYRRDHTWSVHVPRMLKERYLLTAGALDELSNSLGRSPTIDEVAEHTGLTDEDVVEAIEVRRAFAVDSLDVSNDDHRPVQLASGGSSLDQVENAAVLSPLVARLPEREQRILQLRFYDDLSQSEIAKRLGLSQMHISRLLARSLAQLRAWALESEIAVASAPP
ncbi:MAG TPA: SigB/SigF/SigG family RNA polymerase sigma factor [Acidimicrobiales bacterium]|nr:SigB/SigF/SigG family RNA polymerase sigma factor [Acidimicrobiales bacterium]